VAKPGSGARLVNGDLVRDTRLCRAGAMEVVGYDAQQVDDLLRRVAAELDAGGSARPLIENATFRKRKYRRRYDIDAVDRFLNRFLLPPGHYELDGIADDPWGDLPVARFAEGTAEKYGFELQCDSAWGNFGQMPGTRVWFGKAARGLTELRTAEQQTLASVRDSWSKTTFSAGGRSFTLQRTSAAESSSPGVAELLARAARYGRGQFAKRSSPGNRLEKRFEERFAERFGPSSPGQELLDETGTPIFYTAGSNFNWRACACILFPDQRWLRFPVRGSRSANAIMTAVDQAGNRVARYRLTGMSARQKELWPQGSVEIVVHPGRKLTDELTLVLALSANWLGSYFDRPSGGG
jgi:hypothetical protein